MGLLQKGQWVDQWYDTQSSDGEFRRQESGFRSWVTPDGTAGPSGRAGFEAAPGRYHLVVSLACPWAHRALIFRQLKDLQGLIDVTVVEPLMLSNGWEIAARKIKVDQYHLDYLYQLYLKADPDYEGRVTVPVLWDNQTQSIVSNESADIIRMFNSAFNGLTGNNHDYYPEALRGQIDAINERVYDSINNGVYRTGFATSQPAYEAAYHELFEALDWVEQILTRQRYLAGGVLTEADWRLFTTLIRFDAVYYGHFKANRQRIADYPAISNYLRELYQQPGVAQTVNFAHIQQHYYASHVTINPTQVVPLGPQQDFTLPHNRGQLD